jgi:hypothetical protein
LDFLQAPAGVVVLSKQKSQPTHAIRTLADARRQEAAIRAALDGSPLGSPGWKQLKLYLEQARATVEAMRARRTSRRA